MAEVTISWGHIKSVKKHTAKAYYKFTRIHVKTAYPSDGVFT